MSDIVLHQFPFSNFCEKAAWAFQFKGIAPEIEEHLPFLHSRPMRKLSSQTSVPVACFGNQVVAGSADIVDYLEQNFPGPSLLPDDPVARAQALNWQSRLDDVGAQVRGALFTDYLQDRLFFHHMLTSGGKGGLRYKILFLLMSPMLKIMLSKKQPDPKVFAKRVTAELDLIADAARETGYLVGEQFTIADLTAAALFYPVCYPEGTQSAQYSATTETGKLWLARWANHPAVPYIERMYRLYRH